MFQLQKDSNGKYITKGLWQKFGVRVNELILKVIEGIEQTLTENGLVLSDFSWSNKNISDFSLVGSYYHPTTGVINSNVNYASTPKYRAVAGMKFKNPYLGDTTVRQVAFFKADGTFLSSAFNQAEITAPANTYYVAFTRTTAGMGTVKVQSDFWALQQSDLLIDYIHSGNIELNIISIDYATGTFTTAQPHGITGTGRMYITPFMVNIAPDVVDVNQYLPNNMVFGQVVYIYTASLTSNTFQLTANNLGAGTPLTYFSAKATTDFSKFRLERILFPPIFTDFPTEIYKIYVVIKGRGLTISYLYPILLGSAYSFTGANNFLSANVNGVLTSTTAARFGLSLPLGHIDTFIEVTIDASDGVTMILENKIVDSQVLTPFVNFVNSVYSYSTRILERKKHQISGFTLNTPLLANGTNIKIYKK